MRVMSNATAFLKSVGSADLQQYPIDKGVRLESHSFFLFHYDRWLNSTLFLLGDWEVQGIALALWCRAQDQDPVGTLPDDSRLIAALIGMSTDQWNGYLRRDPSPLHGWKKCLVGDEIHLMHPVVTEVALNAHSQRAKGADRSEADKERQRIKRLKANVQALAGERLASNEMYVAQLDAWLEEYFPTGNRTTPRILKGMEALGTRDLNL